MEELEINNEPDETGNLPDLWEAVKVHISPPFNGKTYVVNKDLVRTFKLRSEVVEIK